MNLLERVEIEPPTFANNPLIYFDVNKRMYMDRFVEVCAESDFQSINVQEITGTTHPEYAGKSWLYLLQNGKWIKQALQLFEDNPLYFFEDEIKNPPMIFTIVECPKVWRDMNNKCYLDADISEQKNTFIEHGDELACIAKFATYYEGSTTIKGVKIQKLILNTEIIAMYEYLSKLATRFKLNWSILVNRDLVRRDYEKPDDPSMWMITKNKLSITVKNKINGFSIPVDYSVIRDIVADSQLFFRRFTGKHKELWRK